MMDIARQFETCTKTISRIWRQAQGSLISGQASASVSSLIKGNSGRKAMNCDALQAKIMQVPFQKKKDLKMFSVATEIPQNTLHR